MTQTTSGRMDGVVHMAFSEDSPYQDKGPIKTLNPKPLTPQTPKPLNPKPLNPNPRISRSKPLHRALSDVHSPHESLGLSRSCTPVA